VQLRLRRFKWYDGQEAYTVDGLPHYQEVYIVELTSGDWRFRVIKNGTGWGQWYGPWLSAEDAFAAYQNQ
jgi:hypothetical protein